MLARDRFVVYGGTCQHEFDRNVLELTNEVTNLGLRFNHITHSTWPDSEPGFRLESYDQIEGRHAIVFSCITTGKFELQLRDIIVACKQQYGAASVTAVLSFFRYRRQDHVDKPEEITRLRWFIRELKYWGADRLLVCEPHSVKRTLQFCDEAELKLSICDPTYLFSSGLQDLSRVLGQDKIVVYSPDLGSVGRAMELASQLSVRVVATPKKRINDRVEEVEDTRFMDLVRQMYDVKAPMSCDLTSLDGAHVIMREDELSSGRTAVTRANRLRKHGVESVRLVVTHPVCSPGWKMALFPHGERQPFEGHWFGNTRPRGVEETDYEGSSGGRVNIVNIAPAMAESLIQVFQGIED